MAPAIQLNCSLVAVRRATYAEALFADYPVHVLGVVFCLIV